MPMPDSSGRAATGMHVKICGVTCPEHAIAAADAGATMVGLVFVPRSPRAIGRSTAESILAALPSDVEPVALLAGAEGRDDLLSWWRGAVQLHGDETEDECARIADRVGRVMRGLPFSEGAVRRWDACPAVRMLVVDGPAGGSGHGFDHGALAAIMPSLRAPVLLAGGLGPTTVAAAIARVRPWGVDVSSGVERVRGTKDPAMIAAFCAAAGVRPRRVPPSAT